MAAPISYSITNQQQLKAQTQQVINKTALDLGFGTARKSLTVRIRMRKGVGHRSWNSGAVVTSEALIGWLTHGFRAGTKHKRIKGRPVFDQYIELYSEDIKQLCIKAFKGSGSIKEKAYRAGVMVMNDLKHKVYQGSFNLAPNHGKYAKRKYGAGYGDVPLVATKHLFEALEVVVLTGGESG